MCGPSTEVLEETPAETFLRVTGNELTNGCSYSSDEAENELQLNLLALPV